MIRLQKKDPVTSNDYDTLYWLTSVQAATGEKRHHIITVHVESGVAVKTDGKRLHIACLKGNFPDGDYEIIKRTKSELILNPVNNEYENWPKWETIFDSMPAPNNGATPNIYVIVDPDDMGKTITKFFIQLYSNGLNAPPIDAYYIETALLGFYFYGADVYFTDDNEPMFIVDPYLNRVAVLMSFRV